MTVIIDQAPERSLEQRLGALRHANEIRTRRAQLKRDLKAGRAEALPLLVDPPAWAETMKVVNLLLAVPKVGRVKANQWLVRCRISPSKTLGGLSDRQRRELVDVLRGTPVVRNYLALAAGAGAVRDRTVAEGDRA